MEARAIVLVSGNVQGVFFRSSVRNQARLHRLTGWVRNTADGKVEALFEGDKDDINVLIDYCREGPPGAEIQDVEVEWKEPNGNFSSFEIRD